MECRMYGMQLHFIPRKNYDDPIQRQRIAENIIGTGNSIIIPMGGHGEEGLTAWKSLLNHWNQPHYTHLCAAVGSGTMITALTLYSLKGQKVIGYPAMDDPGLPEEIRNLIRITNSLKQEPTLRKPYNSKDYAKTDEALLDFMNELYLLENLPTDIVYTGKMMFGILSDINKCFYPPGSRLLALHSGGLQGNRSLPPGTLRF
jgi:1-aminocyclopropane-1-carboxylate deaminase